MRNRPTTFRTTSLIHKAFLIVLVAIVSVAMPMAVSAQTIQGTSFVTESGDHTVEWNENWSASLSSEDEFSTMLMLEGQIMIYAVMFMHDPDLGLSERAVYHSLSGVLVNSFDSEPTQSIEWEGSDGSFHGAHVISLSGIDFVIYMRVTPGTDSTGPTMQFASAPTRAFPVSLEAMQQELSIDGVPAMDGENGDDVIARLSGTSSESAPAAEEDAAAETEAPAANPRPSIDSPRIPREAHLPSSQASNNEYVSGNTGFTITWSDAWTNMAESGSTVGEFSLMDDSGRIVVSFTGRSTTETNREAFFQDIVARESRYPGFVGSVVGDDRLLIATWSGDNELAVLEYVFINDETLVTVMVTITSGNPDRYIESVQEVSLEGAPILRDWTELWQNQED